MDLTFLQRMNYDYQLKFDRAILIKFKIAPSVVLLNTDKYCNTSTQHYIPEE